jgi:hypothetical protein
MLYMAAKNFDISDDIRVVAGKDIVDVSNWAPDRVKSMVDNRFLIETDAKVPTKTVPEVETKAAPAESNRSVRRSPLTSREKVFKTRLAKRGE